VGRPLPFGAGLCYDRAMFRTRDFILLFSAIMFLVVAIGTTLIGQSWSSSDPAGFAVEAENDVEYLAMVAGSEEISRAERIAQMRAKISQQALLSEDLTNEVVGEESLETVVATSSSEDVVTQTEAVQCPAYRLYANFWDARSLSLVENEGAYLLARGYISSTSVPEVVLQLPARTAPSGNPSCLPSNVIGIANDGSLIRNDETGLYSVFGSETLIGYALDGFPIYGVGVGATDACGGLVVAGAYRYQLRSDGETIINCFAAAPVVLP